MKCNFVLIIFYGNNYVLKHIENEILTKMHNCGILQDSIGQM